MWRKLHLSTKGLVGVLILGCVVLAAVLAPVISPHDPDTQDLFNGLRPPAWDARGSMSHVLGTDKLGRDILSRIIYGSRVALIISVSSVLLSSVLGTILGMIAGYSGPVISNIIMRLVDIILSLPFILLALVVMSVLGRSLVNLVLVFTIVMWVQYARVAYAQTIEVRERDFVTAAQAFGASRARVMIQHILPNILGPLIVLATLNLGMVILMESGLSFLGLGTPPQVPSWGDMLQEGRNTLNFAWWLATFPGLAIVITVMGFNFLGDWLRDRIDPRIQT